MANHPCEPIQTYQRTQPGDVYLFVAVHGTEPSEVLPVGRTGWRRNQGVFRGTGHAARFLFTSS